eukprot:scaffold92293_cov52-Phaeocystis_antarctica.AAC.2
MIRGLLLLGCSVCERAVCTVCTALCPRVRVRVRVRLRLRVKVCTVCTALCPKARPERVSRRAVWGLLVRGSSPV